MTPTEKALEIANAMYNGNVFDKTKEQHLAEIENAKRCALICVNELIYSHSQNETDNQFYYFQEVKTEIINL
jgi:hypothetical protein